MRFSLLVLLFAILSSCSSKTPNQLSKINFKQMSGSTVLISKDYQKAEASILFYPNSLSYDGWSVDKGQQYFANTPIKGARIRRVKGKKYTYTKGFISSKDHKFEGKARDLITKKEAVLLKLKKENKEYRTAHFIYTTQLTSIQNTPYLSVRFLSSKRLAIVEYTVDKEANIIISKTIGHHFDGEGNIVKYDKGKIKHSEGVIKQLDGDGTLSGENVGIQSASGIPAYNENNVFKYDRNDKNYNEVQAYQFANKFISWFKSELNVKLPFVVSITSHFGGINSSSASFYYEGKIRLGDGDGITFKNMPQDPTVVTHEVAHAFVEHISGLGYEDVEGSFSEGFSDFFTAAYLNTPYMGSFSYLKGDYKRSLKNKKKAFIDFKNLRYNDSLVVSGTFWDIKKVIGVNKSCILAIKTLILLGPGATFEGFREAVTGALDMMYFDQEKKNKIIDILDERGWIKSKSTHSIAM